MKVIAYLWDGKNQLPGMISISEKELTFTPTGFINSNLGLSIKLHEIKDLEFFRIYNLSLNGLKIISQQNKEDMFVVEDPKLLKKQIEKMIHSKHK